MTSPFKFKGLHLNKTYKSLFNTFVYVHVS